MNYEKKLIDFVDRLHAQCTPELEEFMDTVADAIDCEDELRREVATLGLEFMLAHWKQIHRGDRDGVRFDVHEIVDADGRSWLSIEDVFDAPIEVDAPIDYRIRIAAGDAAIAEQTEADAADLDVELQLPSEAELLAPLPPLSRKGGPRRG